MDEQLKEKKVDVSISLIIVTTILLSSVLTGIAVYLWRETVNEDIINTLSERIVDLEENTNDRETAESLEEDDLDENVAIKAFSGNYIKGKIPENWVITELTDESENMRAKQLVESGYRGFLGVHIRDENNNLLVEISPGFGTGGIVCTCDEYVQFPDDIVGEYDRLVKAKELDCSNATPAYNLDIELISYDSYDSEMTLFGDYSVRRVNKNYYFDSTLEDDYFSVDCVILTDFIALKEPCVFESSGLGISSLYQFTSIISSSDNIDEETLLKLDAVLASLEVID